MSWRPPLLSLSAAAVALLAWWMAPWAADALGLGEFAWVARFAVVILALTLFERLLAAVAEKTGAARPPS